MKQNELKQYLLQQKNDQRYRSRTVMDSPQGVNVKIDGKPFVNFCSNDYLGLANHPQVSEACAVGLRLYGVGSGASHLINGHSRAHHELEEALAAFVNRPKALAFSTGYMANVGVISALLEKGDTVFADRLNHASLLDGALMSQARLQRYRHADVVDLAVKLESSKANTKLICTDGVFSMDGDVAPVTGLIEQAKTNDSWLMLDDAHGLGVIGDTGRGTLEIFNAAVDDVPILIGTLGKAFGTFGAFVAGSEELIEYLIQRARSYIYTTALPAAVAEATKMSLKLIDLEPWRRQRLHENIIYFRQCLNQLGYDTHADQSQLQTPIQPIMIGEVGPALKLSQKLKDNGILVSAIRPPTVPENTARLRITLCAEHSHQQIDRLLDALK